MRIDNDPKLDFDDVLIRPKRSEAPSRSAIILEREHRFLNSGATWKGIPIVASNMDTVGTMAMARALGPEMMACLHKYYSDAELIEFFKSNHDRTSVFFTVGIKDEDFDKLRRVREKADVRFVCVDAANGYTKFFVERVKRIREAFPDLTIMAGNVAREVFARPVSRRLWATRSFPPLSSVPTPPTGYGAMFAPMAAAALRGMLSRPSRLAPTS
jgi:GMP reductase